MKISTNSIRQYNQRYHTSLSDIAPDGIDPLVAKIGAQLGAVENVEAFGATYEGVRIARVVRVEDHPNADRLHVCRIDDSGKTEGVERDEQGYVQVVCGAPNVREGLLVAWLPPGATVPETKNDAEPFTLEAKPLRGVVSNGMLASSRELGISNDHEGIVELPEDTPIGVTFAEAFNLINDYIIDIENKMFTHRPDCFGFLGVAREIAGIQGQSFTSPEWYRVNRELPHVEQDSLPFRIDNQLPTLVPRFMAVAVQNVVVGKSPMWLQLELVKVGVRPINAIVDLANYYMLLTGQPLHTYDYDKLKQVSGEDVPTIRIRHPRPQEKIVLLNDKEIIPREEAILIAAGDTAIGIGGVMGGATTEVDETTKNVLLEVATFDMYSIRRSAMAHGLFSDAVTRYTKGQSPLQTLPVLSMMIEEISKFSGGTLASNVIDDVHLEEAMLKRASVYPPITTTAAFIADRLGCEISAETVKTTLEHVECRVEVDGETLTITAPFWRTDLVVAEDIVEEVGRLQGYDTIPVVLPWRTIAPVAPDPIMTLKQRLRGILARAGANEMQSYSFVHVRLLENASQDSAKAFRIRNALSPDLQFYRMSLTPSILEKLHVNQKQGYGHFALFELSTVHQKGQPHPDEPHLPAEPQRLALVLTADAKTASSFKGVPYYHAQRLLTFIAEHLHVEFEFRTLEGASLDAQLCAPYDSRRSAAIYIDDVCLGIIGEYTPTVARSFKLSPFTAGFELDVERLLELTKHSSLRYQAVSPFPSTEQDITLRVSQDVSFAACYNAVREALHDADLSVTVVPRAIYQAEDDTRYKHITFHLTLAHRKKTLTMADIAAYIQEIVSHSKQIVDAEQV